MAVSRGLDFQDAADFNVSGESGCDAEPCSQAFEDVREALGFTTAIEYLVLFADGVGHRELKRRIQAL